MDVGDPFSGLAAVVEIEHRGDRIDPQAVDVIRLSQNNALVCRKLATSRRPKL